MIGRRALGAAAAAIGISRAASPVRASPTEMGVGGYVGEMAPGQISYPENMLVACQMSPERRAAYRAWQSMQGERRSALAKHDTLCGALGGLPPHLASMKSCRPWFLHQRAAAHRERLMDDDNALVLSLARRLGLIDEGSDLSLWKLW